AIARADDAVRNVQVHSGGEVGTGRIDVYQLGGKISIRSARRRPELHDKPAGYFDAPTERRRLEHQHVVARRERPLILAHPEVLAAALVGGAVEHQYSV